VAGDRGGYRSALMRESLVQEATAACFAHHACHIPR
jgi:hypothetical protein